MRDGRVVGSSARVEGRTSGRSGTARGGGGQDVRREDPEMNNPGDGDA